MSAEDPTSIDRRPSRHLWAMGLIVVVTLATWAGAVTDAFLADDYNILLEIRTNGPLAKWSGEGAPFFRPLVSLVYAIDLALWGLDARFFHLTNLALHLGCSLLLLGLGQTLGRLAGLCRDRARETGLVAALIFAVHPTHLEPVAWIPGRSDLLAAFFALGCVFAFARGVRAQGAVTSRPTAVRWLGVSWACLAGALSSKESTFTVPGVLVVVVLVAMLGPPSRRPTLRTAVRWLAPFAAALPLYVLTRQAVLGQWVGGYGSRLPLERPPSVLVENFVGGLSRSIVPLIRGEQIADATFLVLAGLAGTLLALRWRTGGRAWWYLGAFAFAAFAITMLPALGLRPARVSTMTERAYYLPSAFTAVLVACWLGCVVRAPRIRRAVTAILCLVLAAGTVQGQRLWRQAVEVSTQELETVRETTAGGRVYVLATSDNLSGAYTTRNGLRAALKLMDEPARRLVVSSRLDLRDRDTPVRITREGKRFTIEILDDHPHVRIRTKPSPLHVLTPEGRRTLHVELPKLTRRDWVLGWQDGGLRVVQRPPDRADRPGPDAPR